MAGYLIDTTVLIDYFRGNKKAKEFLKSRQDLAISFLTIGELIRGARNKRELKTIEAVMVLFKINWVKESVGKKVLELMNKYSLSSGLGIIDAVLAATALVEEAVLVTSNLKHFRPIAGLTVKRPEELV